MIKKVKNFGVSIILVLIVLFSYNSKVYAIVDRAAVLYDESMFAAEAGYAAPRYAELGYTCVLKSSPSAIVLRSNMASASVMLLAGHGNKNHIDLVNSKLVNIDTTNTSNIDIRTFNWANYGTKLVTYLGCETSEMVDENDKTSIAAMTAGCGAELAVGFRSSFNFDLWCEIWSKRYHEHLRDGYGVLDSLNYANTFLSLDPRIKTSTVWHHGNPNLPITLSNTAQANSNINIKENKNILPINKQNTINANINNITKYISDYYTKFDINNYEIVYNTLSAINVDTMATTEIEYIDFMLKIGDFITTAGFTVTSMNDKIVQIFDNNIDIEKQEAALANSESFVVNEKIFDIRSLKDSAINQIQEKHPNSEIEEGQGYKYYYDVETDKKYIVYNLTSVIDDEQVGNSKFCESVQIEIK